jgi:hypothetical protein
MVKTVKRLVKVGTGVALFLPMAWVKKLRSKTVLVVYDDILLVMPRHYEKKVDVEYHELIKRLAMKEIEEAEAQGSSRLEPQPEHEEVLTAPQPEG